MRDDVGARQQLVAWSHERRADLGGALGGEVLAPREHVHLERASRSSRPREPSLPRPTTPSVLPFEAEPAADLPAALARRAILGGNTAGEREDRAPRELGRRVRAAPRCRRPRCRARAAARHVDGRIAHARGHEELELGQALEKRLAERACARASPSPPRSRPVAPLRAPGSREVIREHHDLGSRGQARPVGHPPGDVLVVIEDRDSAP